MAKFFIDEKGLVPLNIVNPGAPGNFLTKNKSNTHIVPDLFSLFNRCKSSPGIRYLCEIFKMPTVDKQDIEERIDFINYCMNSLEPSSLNDIGISIMEASNLFEGACRGTEVSFHCKYWLKLNKVFNNLIHLKLFCQTHVAGPVIFQDIFDKISLEIVFLRFIIEYFIETDQRYIQENFILKPGIDNTIDILINLYLKLPGTLLSLSKNMMGPILDNNRSSWLMFFPVFGYSHAIIGDIEDASQLNDESTNLKYMFTSNGVQYFKSNLTMALDQIFHDIFRIITQRISQLSLKLKEYIHRFVPEITEIIDLLGKLDVYISFYYVAYDLGFKMPEFNENNEITIIDSWHPLFQRKNVAPNQVHFKTGQDYIKIITGPSGSGKTIYMKQIVIVIFLAQIGSYVPAAKANIGIISKIFSKDLSYESSSILNVSSFSVDMQQIQKYLEDSDSKSLIVIDEFGKGTLEIDSSVLLTAFITMISRKYRFNAYLIVITKLPKVINHFQDNGSVEILEFNHMSENGASKFVYHHSKQDFISHNIVTISNSLNLEASIIQNAMKIKESTNDLELHSKRRKSLHYGSLIKVLNGDFRSDREELKSLMMSIIGIEN